MSLTWAFGFCNTSSSSSSLYDVEPAIRGGGGGNPKAVEIIYPQARVQKANWTRRKQANLWSKHNDLDVTSIHMHSVAVKTVRWVGFSNSG